MRSAHGPGIFLKISVKVNLACQSIFSVEEYVAQTGVRESIKQNKIIIKCTLVTLYLYISKDV